MILMIKDVAVKHPLSRMVVVADDESYGFALSHFDRILPASIALRYTSAVEHLELESVQMEWMIHPDQILDLQISVAPSRALTSTRFMSISLPFRRPCDMRITRVVAASAGSSAGTGRRNSGLSIGALGGSLVYSTMRSSRGTFQFAGRACARYRP